MLLLFHIALLHARAKLETLSSSYVDADIVYSWIWSSVVVSCERKNEFLEGSRSKNMVRYLCDKGSAHVVA